MLEKPVNLDRLGATLRRWLPGGASAHAAASRWPYRQRRPVVGAGQDYAADVSQVFLEEMVAVVGIDRARACVAEFVADATARCMRLGELLPGWEAGSIVRSCEELSGWRKPAARSASARCSRRSPTRSTRDDRSHAEALVERLRAGDGAAGSGDGGVPGRHRPAVEGQRGSKAA